jgi:uncharacterized protein YlxW (UPF0749 family)
MPLTERQQHFNLLRDRITELEETVNLLVERVSTLELAVNDKHGHVARRLNRLEEEKETLPRLHRFYE